jgi:hypothetical protein
VLCSRVGNMQFVICSLREHRRKEMNGFRFLPARAENRQKLLKRNNIEPFVFYDI